VPTLRGRRRLSKHTAQRCLSLCSVIFAQGLTLGIRADNPCAGLCVGKRNRVTEGFNLKAKLVKRGLSDTDPSGITDCDS
jgi:hypothetical protein